MVPVVGHSQGMKDWKPPARIRPGEIELKLKALLSVLFLVTAFAPRVHAADPSNVTRATLRQAAGDTEAYQAPIALANGGIRDLFQLTGSDGVLDIPIIMGVPLIAAIAIVIGNLLADLVTPLIDPRIRLR